ncbi:alpha/beta-hydrolase [Xylariaceae sp. FL0662B]|nr:alpha/beta-hydrolase [Xylariaceae sp. FL0662B]
MKLKDAFIITIRPFNPFASLTKPCYARCGQEAMDQGSLSSSNNTSMSLSSPEKKPSYFDKTLRLFLPAKGSSNRRACRTRWLIIIPSSLVCVILLAVLLGLYKTGHLGDYFKKTIPLQLAQGTYTGEVITQSSKFGRSIQAFRGIPYAQSTTGDNRFRPPQPLNGTVNHKHVQHALKFGNICPQLKTKASQGEDCLNLNIYRPHFGDDPKSATAEAARLGVDMNKLPIAIYVPGGGFNGGSAGERNMLSFAAWSETPLIGINFNYRLGALGFLPSGQTAKEGLLNLGLKDQQFLFEWVRNNAADFGGDPNNVTIIGLSAGAHSVGHHLISYSPANKLISKPPPFQRAILESGGSLARATFVPTHPLHQQQFQQFLVKCGLGDTPDDKLFSELRSLPLNTIVSASNSVWKRWQPTLRWAFQPVIDGPGGIIPDLPSVSWQKGNVLRIPILTGFNTNEGAMFVPSRTNNASAVRTLMSAILPSLNETDVKTLDTLYPDPTTSHGKELYVTKPPTGFGTQFWRLDDAYGHYAYICPVLQSAHLASTAQGGAPVYAYHYAARSGARGAADHGDEGPVVAHDMQVIGRYPGVVATADAMTGFWSRFAATGNPNPSPSSSPSSSSSSSSSSDKTGVAWPRFVSPFANATDAPAAEDKDKTVMVFGSGNDERMGMRGRQNRGVAAQAQALSARDLEECRFWWARVLLSEGSGNGSATVTSTSSSPSQTAQVRL